jgi:predicted nucleotidyltransferase
MKTAAIIAEYNPFHNGHAYQIEQLKSKYAVTHVIVILNASFMQRGEPAMTDKMLRAESALRCGADLVVELPYVYGAQTAELFAAGGVGLANLLHADALSFGCETTTWTAFINRAAAELREQRIQADTETVS